MRPRLIPLKDRRRGRRVAPLGGKVTLDFPRRRGHVLSSRQPIGQYRRAKPPSCFSARRRKTSGEAARAVRARLIANFVFRPRMLFSAANCEGQMCLCCIEEGRNFKARGDRGERQMKEDQRRVEELLEIVEMIELEILRIIYS